MMALRPIVVDSKGMILGGNMRLEALKSLGHKEIPDEWVRRAGRLTEGQKREFIIKDNSSFGEYDWDLLANEWSDLPLTEWGVNLPKGWSNDENGDTSPQLSGMEYRIIVQCESEGEQARLLERFESEGIKCQALIS